MYSSSTKQEDGKSITATSNVITGIWMCHGTFFLAAGIIVPLREKDDETTSKGPLYHEKVMYAY
tara:strand:- start:190 stop:381 length:192 start_codon:yes stop_codon:yes gene_type:complete